MGNLEDLPVVPEEQRRRVSYLDNDHLRLKMIFDSVADDEEMRARWPWTTRLLERLGEAVFHVIDEMDLTLSGAQEAPIDNVLAAEIDLAVRECANERQGANDCQTD